jgi:hypothetical protein
MNALPAAPLHVVHVVQPERLAVLELPTAQLARAESMFTT